MEISMCIDQYTHQKDTLSDQSNTVDYNNLVLNAPIGIFTSVPEGYYLSVNQAMARMFGYETREEMIDNVKDISKQIYADPGDRRQMEELLYRQKEVSEYEFQAVRKDGSVFWASLTVSVVQDTYQAISYYQGFVRDITERKRSEHRTWHLNRVLSANRNVNQLITVEKDPYRLIQGACNRLTETQGYDSAWIALLDNTGAWSGWAQAGLENVFLSLKEEFRRGELPPCARKALKRSDIVVNRDSESNCAQCPLVGAVPGSARITVPIAHQGRTYGVMALSLPVSYAEDEYEWELTQKLAGDIAFALYTIGHEEGRVRNETALQESERFLRYTLDGLSAHIAVLNAQGDIVQVNKAWSNFAENSGIPSERVSNGVNYLNVCFQATGDFSQGALSFAHGIKMVLNGEKEFFAEEYPCPTPEGERWFIGRITPFPDEPPRRVVVSHEEFTERKKAEKALRLSESRFRTLIEDSPDAICIIVDEVFVYLNEAAVELFGADSKDQLLGQTTLQYVHPNRQNMAKENFRIVTQEEKRITKIENVFLKMNGSEIQVEVNVAPIVYNNQKGAIIFARDISERKELEKAREDIERICRHDLKTPLCGIQWLPQAMLSDENLTDKQKNNLQQIYTTSQRMMDILDMSLKLFQIENGEYRVKFVSVDIIRVIKEIRNDLNSLFKTMNTQLSLSIAGQDNNNSVCILGEELLCYTMLSNLIKNAAENIQNGQEVKISLEEKSLQKVGITIYNPGAIPENIQKRFGQKYSTASQQGGTGLGVYSARLIANAMHGRFNWSSSSESGTYIFLELPKAQ